MKKIIFFFSLTGILFAQQLTIKEIFIPPTGKQTNFVYRKTISKGGLNVFYAYYVKNKEDKITTNSLNSTITCELDGYRMWNGIWITTKKDKKTIFQTNFIAKDLVPVEDNERRLFIEGYWQNEENNLSIKIVYLKDFPKWVFVKIESENPIVEVIFLNLQPLYFGPPERQIWLISQNSNFIVSPLNQEQLSKQQWPKLSQNDFSFVLYNKNVKHYSYRVYKKLFVFIPEEVNSVSFSPYSGIRWQIYPKGNEVRMALGYYYDLSDISEEKQQEVIDNFIKVDSKKMQDKLLSIDWEPFYDYQKLEKIFKEIEKYSNKEELKEFLEKNEYALLKEAFKISKDTEDYRKATKIEKKIKEIREKMYDVLIESLKK